MKEYKALWSGYCIKCEELGMEFETEIGVRGINIPVIVRVFSNGDYKGYHWCKADDSSGNEIKIKSIMPILTKKENVPSPVEDEIIFGKGNWVYCNQHKRPHLTGWCTVGVKEKLGLGVKNEKEAYIKCENFNLKIFKG